MSNKGAQGKIRDLVRDEKKRLHSEVRWNNNHVFKDAKTPDEVPVYLDEVTDFTHDLPGLTKLAIKGVSIVKSNINQSEAMPHVTLIDLKLNVFGPVEDQVYAAFPLLIKNIRRGNTILKYYEPGQNPGDSKYSFGRKGLEKFFDLRYEMISPEQRTDDQCLEDEHHMQKNFILGGPLKTILEGSQVEVLKTMKANGENVQVSWNKDIQAWVICSKNVGLVAQTRQ